MNAIPGLVTDETSGRPILIGLAAVVVLVAAGMGALIGGDAGVDTIAVFGVFVLPATPGALAALGAAVTGGILLVLFALVAGASHLDRAVE